MKTTQETIRTTVYVYAQPKTKYQLENLAEGELPFTYHVKDYDYGDETSVRIMEHEILLPIPAGIDITAQCILNLKEKINAVKKQAEDDVADLNQRIRDLSLLEYKPDPDDVIWVDDDGVEITDADYLKTGGTD